MPPPWSVKKRRGKSRDDAVTGLGCQRKKVLPSANKPKGEMEPLDLRCGSGNQTKEPIAFVEQWTSQCVGGGQNTTFETLGGKPFPLLRRLWKKKMKKIYRRHPEKT